MNTLKHLTFILERASKYYIKKHLDKYTARIESVTKQWRRWVREQLSIQYVKGTRNTSLYPRLRTGNLRASLVARRIVVKRVSTSSNSRAKAEITIPVSFNKLKNDYGEKLNSAPRFAGSTFFGWKDRVQQNLELRLKGRI